ncbi:MAG TPA: CDP-glycerol glycerophosphotransferase family protein [Lachnospiraceae bacterium]|nr:CDP-glycerol glycerophosphotransferase family protein [Lachnospiraceae bacterium]
MKKIGYLIFAFFFTFFRIFGRVNRKKVFCIMTHDSSEDSNVGMIVQQLRKESNEYKFYYISKEETSKVKNGGAVAKLFSFFLVKPYHLATSQYVFLDNIFLPMAYLHFSSKVKVVQLWHGTGTIKKFGQDVNTGELWKLERNANRTITHLIVNSEKMKKQYAKAFGVDNEKVFVEGLPRTDVLFRQDKLERDREAFLEKYPELKGRRCILYAPTFRDQETDKPKVEMDIDQFVKELPGDTVLLLKLHPFVAKNFSLTKEQKERYQGRVYNMSSYRDINTLLHVSDVLITDYSSIIFEYCLQEKPMLFYAYDLGTFTKEGRGFYEPYETFVPGPVARTSSECIEYLTGILSGESFDRDEVRRFKEENFQYFDGKSTERVVKLVK